MYKAKNFPPSFKYFLNTLLIILLSSFLQKAAGQDKLNVAVGVGVPEFINAGLRFQLPQVQIGGAIGTFPIRDENFLTLSGDVFFHFAGKSRFSKRRPTYARLGFTYMKEEKPSYFKEKDTYLNLRIGRDLNISERFGFDIDGGIAVQLTQEKIDLSPSSGFNLDLNFPVIPSASFGMFYRFK